MVWVKERRLGKNTTANGTNKEVREGGGGGAWLVQIGKLNYPFYKKFQKEKFI